MIDADPNRSDRRLLVLAALVGADAARRRIGRPREIRIVARQMSFMSMAAETSNPSIVVKPGERVRLTLVNEDAGIDHDFAVPAWRLTTPLLEGEGTERVVFDAPPGPATPNTSARLHVAMMTGTIEVRRRPAGRPMRLVTVSETPLARALASPEGKRRYVRTSVCHHCRPLRFHHRGSVGRSRPALEAARGAARQRRANRSGPRPRHRHRRYRLSARQASRLPWPAWT